MASGFLTASAADLDTLLMARVNTKRADVGFQVASVDISNRYEPIGSGTPRAATGFVVGTADLAILFRDIADPLIGTVSIADMTVNSIMAGGGATGQYSLRASGDIFGTTGTNTVSDIGDWLSPQLGMSGFEAMAALVSGSAPLGPTLGSWFALSSDRTWSRLQTIVGAVSTVIDVSIRRASDAVVLDTARITINAQRTS